MTGDGKKSNDQIQNAMNGILFKNDHQAAEDGEEREEVEKVQCHNFKVGSKQ